jgi:predicted ATPase
MNTRWIVLTGGPSTGKSKTLAHLAFLGCAIRPEAARVHIDDELSRGRSLAQIRADEAQFQRDVLALKIAAEARTPPGERIFWERGMPDSIVYLAHCGADEAEAVAASQTVRYEQVFVLDRLPGFEADYARTEDESAARTLHDELERQYRLLGYAPVRVPVLPIAERAQFILAYLAKTREPSAG